MGMKEPVLGSRRAGACFRKGGGRRGKKEPVVWSLGERRRGGRGDKKSRLVGDGFEKSDLASKAREGEGCEVKISAGGDGLVAGGHNAIAEGVVEVEGDRDTNDLHDGLTIFGSGGEFPVLHGGDGGLRKLISGGVDNIGGEDFS